MTDRNEINWKVEGKKFNKRKVAVISEELPVDRIGQQMASGGGIFDSLSRQIEQIKKVLFGKGFDANLGVPIFRGRYFARHQSNEQRLRQLKEEGLLIENDSMEDWAVALWQHAEIALNENNALEHRLASSCEVGRLRQVMVTYAEYGKSQSKAARKPRTPEVNEIIGRLAGKEAAAKDLWREFYGELDKAGFSPNESSEENEYRYTNEKGLSGRIKFTTFQNKLSSYRRK